MLVLAGAEKKGESNQEAQSLPVLLLPLLLL